MCVLFVRLSSKYHGQLDLMRQDQELLKRAATFVSIIITSIKIEGCLNWPHNEKRLFESG